MAAALKVVENILSPRCIWVMNPELSPLSIQWC